MIHARARLCRPAALSNACEVFFLVVQWTVRARHSSHSLAMLLAKRVHVLVIDPSGCGKSRV